MEGDGVFSGMEEDKFPSCQQVLHTMSNYPYLTKELEETGNFTQFKGKSPQERIIEIDCLKEVMEFKNRRIEKYNQVINQDKYVQGGKLNALMDCSLETVVKLMETMKGKPVGNFQEVLEAMKDVTSHQIKEIQDKEIIMDLDASGGSSGDPDLLSPKSMASTSSVPFLSVLKASSVVSSTATGGHVFPSAAVMAHDTAKNIPCTPAQSVFEFGSVAASTAKAPRLLKPGEIAFSEGGSPLLLPRLGVIEKKAERIPVNDADGRKIVEVVIYKGEESKDKEYKDFVTDIRGLVATKSIKKDRIMPPRVWKGAGSVKRTGTR